MSTKILKLMAVTGALMAGTVVITGSSGQKVPGDIIDRLTKLYEDIDPENIHASPIPGVYELTSGPAVAYITADGKYLLEGDLIDVENDRNLSEIRRGQFRAERIGEIGMDNMIVFSPQNPKHTLVVFTDVGCIYCRRFHDNIKQYNRLGIAVAYAFYPLRGLNSETFEIARRVLCSTDQRAALTRAKQDKPVKSESCNSPIMKHVQAAMAIGVRGTPSIFTQSGIKVQPYPPEQMLKFLESAGS